MADPYVYPGTNVLINKEGIRNQDELQAHERIVTLQRMRQGFPSVEITPSGYREIHHHLFQDVYDWAGQDRKVDMAKGNSFFCRSQYIAQELDKRFDEINADSLQGMTAAAFADKAATHLNELNAIHPFREGNGRTARAFLQILGDRAGHVIDLTKIDPEAWNNASIRGFHDGNAEPLRGVIAPALTSPPQQEQGQPNIDAGKAARLAELEERANQAETAALNRQKNASKDRER